MPDVAYERASSDASTQGIEIASFCSGILADHFLLPVRKTEIPKCRNISTNNIESSKSVTNGIFNVVEHFQHFPSESIRLAQAFVDEVFKFPHVEAFKVRRGIGFKPNFVFIEYLMSRGGKAGIGVSFYGEPSRHKNPPSILVPGIPSYSRAKIYSEAELQKILPHIRQSHELKFGPR